jgi:AraC-like DNA-binding protein
MKQELENALKSDERVSLSAVAQQLGCDSAALRKGFPDLCRAVVTRYRERFDYEQIQRRLQEVLASNEIAPFTYSP